MNSVHHSSYFVVETF